MLAGLALAWSPPAAAQKPPTAEELDRRLKGPPPDERHYQKRSARSFDERTGRAADWVKNKLSGFHVTPARLCLALGIVGLLFSRNKNHKKHRGWLVIYIGSWLAVLAGALQVGMKYLS